MKNLQPIYPDVLSTITGGPRINLGLLECAVGLYPHMAYINQPFELIVILQSMVDQPLPVKVSLRLPTTDQNGNVVLIEAAKQQVAFNMNPGEVGVLRFPMIARPPTKASQDLPIKVAIRYKEITGQRIRPPGGGAAPTILSVSPFKVQALKETHFIDHKWDESTDILTVKLNLAAKTMPGNPAVPKVKYEPLWTQAEHKQEIELIKAHYNEALELAKPGAMDKLFYKMREVVTERFATRGMPLHPGEATAIAKVMTYTVEDAPTKEQNVILENTRWFRALCYVLTNDAATHDLDRDELLSQHIFNELLYDAIMIGFHILEYHVTEDLGSMGERVNYANQVLTWFGGHGDGDLTYIYLPLVLAGVAIGRTVGRGADSSPWDFHDQLIEAYNGRIRLADDNSSIVFDLLMELLQNYASKLRAARIERPIRDETSLPNKPITEIKRPSEFTDKPKSQIRRLNKK
ncbi:MAG: hypothetical protein D6711_18655 [Chloroflexi bacterium]|nr:MAG: hypothetical protein D6711_18655 [Chloroflexota bacterium]